MYVLILHSALTVKTWWKSQHTFSLWRLLSTIWMKLQNLWYHMKDEWKQSFMLVRTRGKERSMRTARAPKSSIMRCWKIKWSSAVNRWRSYNVYWTERSTEDRIIRLSGSSLISMVILTLCYSKILQDDTNICELQVSCPCQCHWCHHWCHWCHLCLALALALAHTINTVAPSLVLCMLGWWGQLKTLVSMPWKTNNNDEWPPWCLVPTRATETSMMVSRRRTHASCCRKLQYQLIHMLSTQTLTHDPREYTRQLLGNGTTAPTTEQMCIYKTQDNAIRIAPTTNRTKAHVEGQCDIGWNRLTRLGSTP